jgi:hypothetical protein
MPYNFKCSPESSPESSIEKSEMPHNFKCSPGAVEGANLKDKLDNVISCHPCQSHITPIPRGLPSPKITLSGQYSDPDGGAKYLTFPCSLQRSIGLNIYLALPKNKASCVLFLS